jgi:glycosyltransferase involved in cell wall biosynthesis
MVWPRISIVTPSYNQGRFVGETIRSIVDQGYPNLEYVVIDGGSTDNSVDIIRKYAKHLDYWVSETDRGQSHAINKGIARCSGDIFNWINSDDLLMPGALHAVAEAWMKKPGAIVSGGIELFRDSGVFRSEKARGLTLRNFVRFWEAQDFWWHQPCTFVPMGDVKEMGGMREDLTYCMDYHMMVQLLQRGVEVSYVDRVLARFRYHADSKTVGAKAAFRLERVPMLRSMEGVGVSVSAAEWDAEQARRLVDIGRYLLSRGGLVGGARALGKALVTSPTGAVGAIMCRVYRKLVRVVGGR